MSRKKTRHLLVLGSTLLMIVLFLGLANAIGFNAKGAADLVYSVGKQQGVKLLAQNDEAQKVLEVYNIIYNADFMSAASSVLCEEDPKICEQIPKLRMAINAAGSISDPSAFTTQLIEQEFCDEEPEMCTAYGQALSAYGQASTPWGTAKNYAMSKAVGVIDADLARQASQVMMVKGYLDQVVTYDEKQEAKGLADPASEALEEDDEEAWFADGSGMPETENAGQNEVITDVLSEHRADCIVAFNLDGTYGRVANCVTKTPGNRQGHDLSPVIAQPAGTLLLGRDCKLARISSGLAVSTKNLGGERSACFMTLKGNTYGSLIGGEIAKGPNDERMTSAVFSVNADAKLESAQFQVAEESEYVFDEKKYKLQEGITVFYDGEQLKLGTDYVEEPEIELFSFSGGKWVESGVVVPTSIRPVDIDALPDGRYRIAGHFEVQGEINDIEIGPDSEAVVRGVTVRTTERNVRFSYCADSGEGEWIDYCQSGDNKDFYAQGNGFAFKESIERGRYYYLKGGKAIVRLEQKPSGKYKRIGFMNGNIVAPETNLYLKQHNKVFEFDVPEQIEMMGFESGQEDIAKTIETFGGEAWRVLGGNGEGATLDTLKGFKLLEESSEVDETAMFFEDSGVMVSSTAAGICVTPMEEEQSFFTGAMMADITGMQSIQDLKNQAFKKQQYQEEYGTAPQSCDAPGNMKIKKPNEPGPANIELRGIISKDFVVNGKKAETIYFSPTYNLAGIKIGKQTYYADPWSKKFYIRYREGSGFKMKQVGSLNDEQLEYVLDEIEDDENYKSATESNVEEEEEEKGILEESMEKVKERQRRLESLL